MATRVLSRAYDHLYAKHGGSIPVPYLRALAQRESQQNPNEQKDPAWGLMQVIPSVLQDFNEDHGTNYDRYDLLNPDLNVRIATDVLKMTIRIYRGHKDPNLKEDWANPEFVNLVTAGWNSGMSNTAGVGKVASYLEARGIPVTHDNVFKYAAAAGATRHLQNDRKRWWQKTVTKLYFEQPDALQPFGFLQLGLMAFVAWGVYKLWFK